MNARVGHQIGLQCPDVSVDGSTETHGGGHRGSHPGDQLVEVSVVGTLDVQSIKTDVVQGLVVEGDSHVLIVQ